MHRRMRSTLVRLALVAVLPLHALAQSAGTQLKVTTTVVKNCTITSTDVAFGSYDPVGANRTAPLDGIGSLIITCTTGTSATVGIDAGANGNRRMNNGSGVYLTYELYKDGGRTQVWGNTGGALLNIVAAPTVQPRTFTVYGRVPPTQDVAPGSYNDQVVATVNF